MHVDITGNAFYDTFTMNLNTYSLLRYLSRKKLFCRIPAITL
jgi:hypothetical protein